MRLDPVFLEILSNQVTAAADEMYVTLQRASRSNYVKEAADFATAILDRDGNLFAHPPSATFNFLIDTNYADTLKAVPDLAPGDVVFTNDPYLTNAMSTHLPDLHMIMPYFHEGEIVAYGWCFVHCTDVGGAVPSSIAPSLSEIFQEGIRIPPLKALKRGEWNEDFLALFMANNRAPDINMGDMKAMLGALNVGARRVGEMIERHGMATFLDGAIDLQDYADAKAREVLRRIPEGTYEFWDYMDDDFATAIPLRVRVRLTARDGTLHVDLTGTDPQVRSAYNVPTNGRRNYWITYRLSTLLTTYDPSMPRNAGMYRAISVTNPAGTVMNAEFPDACGIRAAPARRLADAITGALLKADADLMPVPSGGTSTPFALAEFAPATGRRVVHVIEPARGGMGALKGQDGVDGRDNSMNNMRNHPVETVEAEAGVIVHAYDIRPDSGGPGEWRGGVAQVIEVEVLRDGGIILARGMERLRFPAFGVAGGKPGGPMRVIRNRGRAGEKELGKIDTLAVNAGDTVAFVMPGGAGYGDPFRRPPEKVQADVARGFVTAAAAERDYGVVLANGGVDEESTARLRQSRVRENIRADFDFGPEREAWERVFDDETVCDLNRRLMELPRSVRWETRKRIVLETVPDLPRAGAAPLTEAIADAESLRERYRAALAATFGEAAD